MIVMTTDPERVGVADGQQRLSEEQDRLSRYHQQRVCQHPGPDVRRQHRARGPPETSRTCSARWMTGLRRRGCGRRRRGIGGVRQRAGQAGQQDHHRRLPPGRIRHPHRALSRARRRPKSASAATARCSPTSQVPASYRSAMAARLKIMCDLDISERRKPQDGKIKFKKFGPARHRAARGDHTLRRRRRRHRDAYPRRRRADPARQAGADGAQPGDAEGHVSASPTACSLSAARPVRARPPRCTRCSATSTRRTPRSGPRRIRSRSPRRAAPGADESEGRHDLRGGDEGLPARRPGHHHGRRDARQGNHRASASRPR
jgi:hypothetical protein